MAEPEHGGGSTVEGTEASEALMNGFILVFMCVLAATLIMNHTLGHKFHVSLPATSAPFAFVFPCDHLSLSSYCR